MLKGAHKQMIVVRTRDSRLFEEAHFVMRRGAGEYAGDDLDLVFEANRIIENSLPKGTGHTAPPPVSAVPPRGTSRRLLGREAGMGLAVGLLWFFGGFLSGGGLVALLWWIL